MKNKSIILVSLIINYLLSVFILGAMILSLVNRGQLVDYEIISLFLVSGTLLLILSYHLMIIKNKIIIGISITLISLFALLQIYESYPLLLLNGIRVWTNRFFLAILSIPFSFFGGILILMSPSMKQNPRTNKKVLNYSVSPSNRLLELKKLLDEGIISKEVFDEKSKKYIEEL